jgi:hypothetical protein
VLLIVTVVPAGTAPATGLNVGVATAGAIVYATVATALLLIPLSYAIALIVSAAFTVTVTGEALPPDALGALPLVV